MRTVTVSMRLPEQDAARLEKAAEEMGVERSTFFRWAMRRGAQSLMLECACDAYRKGDVTLSRAADMADVSVRDMLLRLHDQGVELNYDGDELTADLRPL